MSFIIPDELMRSFVEGLTQRLERLTSLLMQLKQPDLDSDTQTDLLDALFMEATNLYDASFMYEQSELELQAKRFTLDVVDLRRQMHLHSTLGSLSLVEQGLVKLAVVISECQHCNRSKNQ